MMSSTPRHGLVNKAAPGMVERAKASLQQKSIPTQETTLQIGLVELLAKRRNAEGAFVAIHPLLEDTF